MKTADKLAEEARVKASTLHAYATYAAQGDAHARELVRSAFAECTAAIDRLRDMADAKSAGEARDAVWQPISTCPQTGFFLVTEDTAVRALWRSEGEWESPDYPGIEDGWGGLIVGDDAKRLTGGLPLVVSQGVREPHHWMHVPEGLPMPDEGAAMSPMPSQESPQ